MDQKRHNIELTARLICERAMRKAGWDEEEVTGLVDRLWHAYAASLSAGIMDDDGTERPHTFAEGLAAYDKWRAENPDYEPPPPPRDFSSRRRRGVRQ